MYNYSDHVAIIGAGIAARNLEECLILQIDSIKDPTQNIKWITPQGGGGPNYQGM